MSLIWMLATLFPFFSVSEAEPFFKLIELRPLSWDGFTVPVITSCAPFVGGSPVTETFAFDLPLVCEGGVNVIETGQLPPFSDSGEEQVPTLKAPAPGPDSVNEVTATGVGRGLLSATEVVIGFGVEFPHSTLISMFFGLNTNALGVAVAAGVPLAVGVCVAVTE